MTQRLTEEQAVYTHQFADKEVWAELKRASHDDFLSICTEATR